MFPVFAQYNQNARCHSKLDGVDFVALNLTFAQIEQATWSDTKDERCLYREPTDFDACDSGEESVDTFLACVKVRVNH